MEVVVLKGRISGKGAMRSVLQSIVAKNSIRKGVLRISCDVTNTKGLLALSKGAYITGGRLTESGESGYSAVRRLLSVDEGSFAYLDCAHEYPAEVNQSLHINVNRLIDLISTLDTLSDEAFEQWALVDKLHVTQDGSQTRQLTVGTHRTESRADEKSVLRNWKTLSIDGTDQQAKPDTSDIVKTTSFVKLRDWESKHMHFRAPVFWGVFALIAMIVCILIVLHH